MNRILLAFSFLIPMCLLSQQTLDGLDSAEMSGQLDTIGEKVFYKVDQMPEFPGGHEALFRFIQKHLEYPEMARKHGIEGRVLTEFTVDSVGAIADINILRAIGGGCEEETIRVLNLMPDWEAGIHEGKPVNVRFHLPLSFVLPREAEKEEE